MESIILASGSLRRQEYFKMMGLPYNILVTDIDEGQISSDCPKDLTAKLAVKKVEMAMEVMKKSMPKWICGADTVIALNDKILGKPQTREEAAAMLKKLSGKQHDVVTSIALYNGNTKEIDCRTAVCTVTFAVLSDAEIEWYLDTNEWQGVSGAYRIQELASCFISEIKGSPSAVAGLPLHEFYVMLRDNGFEYGA
jgi:septum formation protein